MPGLESPRATHFRSPHALLEAVKIPSRWQLNNDLPPHTQLQMWPGLMQGKEGEQLEGAASVVTQHFWFQLCLELSPTTAGFHFYRLPQNSRPLYPKVAHNSLNVT